MRKWKSVAKASAIARQQKALGKLPAQIGAGAVPLSTSAVLVKEKVIESERPVDSWWARWRASRGRYWSDTERALFFRQLATFYAAGVSLERALLHLAGSARREPLHRKLKEMALQLQRGAPFPKAAEGSGLFSVLHLGVISAGEAGGELERVLQWLASSEESLGEYRSRLGARLAYPGLVMLCVWLAAPMFLLGLSKVVAAVQENLPGKVVSPWLLHPATPWLALFVPPALIGLARILFLRGSLKLSRLPLGLGSLIEDQQSIWVGRVLAQLLKAGLRVSESLILIDRLGSQHQMRCTMEKIEQGYPLGQSLPATFPRLLKSMVTVGEETGDIPELMSRACDILEWSWESRVEAWLSLAEPLLLAALGLVAGLTVLACAGPLTRLIETLG